MKLKIDNFEFHKPEELLSVDDNNKDKFVKLLINPDSKLSIWLENFSSLKNNIDKWRAGGRYNNITLSYVFEKGSSFHFDNDRAYTVDDFEKLFAKYIADKKYLDELTNPQSFFVNEAQFWLKNYRKVDFLEIIIDYLEKNIPNIDKEICTHLIEYILQTTSNIDYYWNNIKPLADKAYNASVLKLETLENQKKFLINGYEKLIVNADFNIKKDIIAKLRQLNSSHKMVKRFDNEQKVFDILKIERTKKLKEEQNQRQNDVIREIDGRMKQRKNEKRESILKFDRGIDEESVKNHIFGLIAIISIIIGFIWGFKVGGVAGGVGGGIVGFFCGAFGGILIAAILSFFLTPILNYIWIPIKASETASQVTISSNDQQELDRRIKVIDMDILQKLSNLDNEIRNDISQMTDEKIERSILVNT